MMVSDHMGELMMTALKEKCAWDMHTIQSAYPNPECFNEMLCHPVQGRVAFLKLDYLPFIDQVSDAANLRRNFVSRCVALRFMDSDDGFQWHISHNGGAFEPSYSASNNDIANCKEVSKNLVQLFHGAFRCKVYAPMKIDIRDAFTEEAQSMSRARSAAGEPTSNSSLHRLGTGAGTTCINHFVYKQASDFIKNHSNDLAESFFNRFSEVMKPLNPLSKSMPNPQCMELDYTANRRLLTQGKLFTVSGSRDRPNQDQDSV